LSMYYPDNEAIHNCTTSAPFSVHDTPHSPTSLFNKGNKKPFPKIREKLKARNKLKILGIRGAFS
jgi:hypothetical protein